MKTRMIFMFTLVVVMLGACAKSSGGDSNGSEGAQGVGEQLIKGNWKDSCKVWGGGDYLSSGYNIASFADSTLVISGDSFKTTDCTGDKISSMKMTFTFEIPSRSSLGPDIFNFNSIVRKVTYIIADQDTANAMNTMAYCGFTDWVIGVEKDITDKPCLSGPKSGETIYTIMKITDTELLPGEPDDAHNGTTPELRHVQLATQGFSKVQ